ncbi:hypothetical protein [Robertkochia solimangrovi]|uniref:hypothetical protein n=1 Tax=Robertkochia solimangrovi TaxID=2213046 RepID=UPI00117D1E05|nr:hypothetical protein [Robertkochia solimangrovi]TRZ43121.1 hypothetical protein DMZ48_10530 [Robertkochia solimangrovi]
MNLTKEITSRKLNFEPQVEISNESIKIKDIGISIDLIENFVLADKDTFNKFKAEYQFPKNSELNKKDRESFADAIFEPVFILENSEKKRPIIACYLFDVRALKGKNNLNIRSINKFELMWTSYLAEPKNDRRLNAKRIVTNELNGAISETYRFEYKTKNDSKNKLSNLKILTIEIKDYVLTFYIVDDEKNSLNQAELEKFINGIKN